MEFLKKIINYFRKKDIKNDTLIQPPVATTTIFEEIESKKEEILFDTKTGIINFNSTKKEEVVGTNIDKPKTDESTTTNIKKPYKKKNNSKTPIDPISQPNPKKK